MTEQEFKAMKQAQKEAAAKVRNLKRELAEARAALASSK